jgi:tetratricopeptide (TPR) repeat protein
VRAGDVVADRFVIEALAGSGGMADVYRARDRTTEDLVALKLLRATGPEDLARLAREAQALSRLTHPGIVRYVAHGTAAGEPFVAMEWIEGDTLSKALRKGPLSVAAALELGRALGSALGHAHQNGIVHRDVKPGNVVLRDGKLDDPILLDFGVARTGLAVGLTQVGTVIGTPRYMAPEQARGGTIVDARADVFALGALLFKCMTGRAPFDGEDAIAVLAHLLFDEAPDVCALIPNVPRAVGDVLAKMLAKEPEGRYSDCGAVVRALELLDASEIPVSVAMPAPSGLTLRERRLLSLMVLTGKVNVEAAKAVANDFGGRAERLANGSVVVVVSGRENASELARVSARCALELRHAMPDAPIVLATGRGEDVAEDATQTSGDSTGSSSRYSGVFERAAGLLRREPKEILKDLPAGPLPIMIDDTTAGLLGADFEIARGKGENPHSLRGRAKMRGQYTLLGKPTPFVGRARELSSLLATWADVCDSGVARAVLVSGDAGLGKSRLLHEALAALSTPQQQAPALLLRAKADATTAGSPFAALGAALRREMGIEERDDPRERWNKLAARVGTVVAEGETHVADFVAEIAGLRVADPTEQVAAARRDPRLMGDRIRRAWAAWIRGECARGPVMIVLEDFQWGDLPTVKLFEDMLLDCAEEPIFVLALARPDIDQAFPNLWSRVVSRVPLVGLSKKAATTFVKTMLATASAETVERIVTLASGNALYLEELVRSAAEGHADAPESLLAMLSSQVESLPDAERRVLRAASIFGNTFWTDGVCVLLGGDLEPNERVRNETQSKLDALAQKEMVASRDGSRLASQRELAFKSALVRDVTYAMLTEDDKRLGHALAADWLERSGETDPFVLAEHAARAGRTERAAAEYGRAAQIAFDACDYAMAIDRVARAEACGASGQTLAELLVLASEAHRWLGRTTECRVIASRAMDLAKPSTSAYYKALRMHAYAASFGGALAELDRAGKALLGSEPPPEALADWVRAMAHLANSYITAGQVQNNELIISRLERVPIERLENDREMMDILRRAIGMRAYGRGDYSKMATLLKESAEARREIGDMREVVIQISNVGFALMFLGRMDDALAEFEEARKGAVQMKLATLELNAIQNSAFIHLCLGDYDKALAGSREALSRAKVEAPRSIALAHLCIARCLLACGADGAEPEARFGVDHAPTSVVRMYAYAVLADTLLAAGKITEARAASNESIALLRTIGSLAVGDIFSFIVRAEVLEKDGDPDGALEAIREGQALWDTRRAFLKTDEARELYDTKSPDAARLRESYARLV